MSDGLLQELVNDTGVTPAAADANLEEPQLDPVPYGFSIGRDSGGFAMDGQVDEVAVWESALTGADIQNLWTIAQTGVVVTADFDSDGDKDGADFFRWQRGFGTTGTPGTLLGQGDADGNGNVNGLDLDIWEAQLGTSLSPLVGALAVPEPSWMALVLLACLPRVLCRGRLWQENNGRNIKARLEGATYRSSDTT